VLALPLLAVVLGALLGFDLVGAFLSPVGAVCALVGVVLVIAAARWNRRLLRWARERDPTPGLACDLYAIALAGGASLDRAGAIVGAACASAGLPLDDSVDAVLGFARTAGVPVIALLGAEADGARRESRAAAAERAVRLETRLLLPLGLCVLPAFVLLGVVPIALAILSSTALAA
jgi:tight adherence protein B